jgi:uncharacterized protein YecE (DUF72 family)
MYSSDYSAAYLDMLAQALSTATQAVPTWCIFDNTALGAATANALDLCARLNAAGQEQAVVARRQEARPLDSHSSDRESHA